MNMPEPKYRLDNYWNGHRSLALTDAQARALSKTLAIVLNDPTWPFTNSGQQRALGNALANLHLIMMKRVIDYADTQAAENSSDSTREGNARKH